MQNQQHLWSNTSEPEPVKPQEFVKEHINQSSTIESGAAPTI